MLTNTWIKKHMEVLSGQIDNSIYEKKDEFESATVVYQSEPDPNTWENICFDPTGEFTYHMRFTSTTSGTFQKRRFDDHSLIIESVQPFDAAGTLWDFRNGLISEHDGNLYILATAHSTESGNTNLWIHVFEPDTFARVDKWYIGNMHDLDNAGSTANGWVGPKMSEFKKNIFHIVTYASYDDGSDPAFIRVDLSSKQTDSDKPSNIYYTNYNAGAGVTTENALTAVVIEDYTDPNEIKYDITFHFVDGFTRTDWETDGTAQAYLKTAHKGFDDPTDTFTQIGNIKFIDLSGFNDGMASPEDKADFMTFGTSSDIVQFQYSLSDGSSVGSFICSINVKSGSINWWPYNPTSDDGNNTIQNFYTGWNMYSKHRDLMFVVSTYDLSKPIETRYSGTKILYTLDSTTLQTIDSFKYDIYDEETAYFPSTPEEQLNWSIGDFTKVFVRTGLYLAEGSSGSFDNSYDSLLIDTRLTTGTNTLEGLNIIEHSYGIGQKPLDPNDTELETELERKALLNKFSYENFFISQTNLLENELNGQNLYEFGTQSKNNILVSRDSINRYKDESLVLSFEKQIRNTGRRQRETKYMQNELTKFYTGVGVLENVKINALEALLDDTVITTSLPSLVEHKGDTELELTFSITTINPVDINRFRLVNTLNVPLQDIMLAATRHLKGESEYTFKIRLKGEEI